jgi:uncharacterized surface protein with fasciclin (FAS1) repeats
MKFQNILALAALSNAFVVPTEEVFRDLAIQDRDPHHSEKTSLLKKVPCGAHHVVETVKEHWRGAKKASQNVLDDSVDFPDHVVSDVKEEWIEDSAAVQAWLVHNIESEFEDLEEPEEPQPPHHGPPKDGPPHYGPGKKPWKGHKKPWKGHKKPHHGKPNSTIYELISKSKYTTKLAELIADDSELVELLNSTKANFTIFAPTDAAFEKIPKHHGKPPKEFIKKVLLYHVAPGLYPAGRLLFSHTVPSLVNETLLGDKPQRLSVKLGFGGVKVNYYSKIVAANIPATNGIIHGVDHILIPPPKTLRILSFLPTEFSTLLLGLGKTGLLSALNETSSSNTGGTFFAPPNGAFKKLGPRINAFLFSHPGAKFLKALLEYHVVANQTLYSNAYYGPKSAESEVDAAAVPYFHFDLPTLLGDNSLAVDVTRYGPFISIKLNGFVKVVVQDGLAKDGVIQVVSNVLIPPRKSHGSAEAQHWDGETEMSVEEFKERLSPFVKEGSEEVEVEGEGEWKVDL